MLRFDSARAWSDAEVVGRYGRLFPAAAALEHELPSSVADERACLWRARLYDVSWLMRCLAVEAKATAWCALYIAAAT